MSIESLVAFAVLCAATVALVYMGCAVVAAPVFTVGCITINHTNRCN